MLLGIEDGIPPEVQEAFQETGTSHVIVISGSNIALLAGVLLALLGRLIGRIRAVIPVIVVIILYVLLVGAGPAALRAGLMGALFVGAIGLGRQSTAWVSLAASALLMTVLNPSVLWDVGFQVSFAATLGLIFLSPGIATQFHRAFGGRLAGEQAAPPLRAISDGLAATLAAQVLVMPVILFHFGRFSVTSLLANALILPAQPPIVAGGMLALLAGLVWEPLGRLIAWVPWLFLTYTTEVVELVAGLPFGVVEAGPWAKSAAIAYIVVLLSFLGLWKGTRMGFLALPPRRHLAMIGAIALPLWVGLAGASLRPDGMLHITFQPSVGSESALLTLPDGTRLLITDVVSEQSEAAISLTARRVELLLAPGGLEASDPMTQVSDGRWMDPTQLAPHTRLHLSGDVTLERLGDAEHWALALRYGAFQTILPATLDAPTQDALVDQRALSGTTLVKLPGGDTGCWPSEEFLNAATPQVLLWPDETTYPSAIAYRLTGWAQRVPGDAAIEVITDGKMIRLRQLTSAQGFLP
jgi:ComEC/Rec2-related protein